VRLGGPLEIWSAALLKWNMGNNCGNISFYRRLW